MKRKQKCIISLLLIVVLISFIVVTMILAKDDALENNLMQNNMMPSVQKNGQTAPEKPEGNQTDKSGSNADDVNPQDNITEGEELPEMPNGNGAPGNINGETTTMNTNNLSTIKNVYYFLFAIESLALAIIISYIIMSRFHKKKLKETFYNGDKKVIFILIVIIFTACLTYVNKLITQKVFMTNNDFIQTENNNQNISYSAAKEITSSEDLTTGSFSSEKSDENAILVSGDINASLSNVTIDKTGDSDGGDNTSFYGTNSAILAKDKAILTIKNAKITTNATGANGVFSYGGFISTNNTASDGTTVNISDSTIITKKDNSGGIMTTGGGVMNASNLTISTSGTSSAAIRTDKGGGKVNVDGGTYKTTGQGSPAIYSTASVTVKNANLNATSSEGIIIEGKNSVSIEKVTLTDTNNKLNGLSTTYKNIFIYQSMSGDAASGEASFSSVDSNITTNKGDSFYVTNTKANITLENNKIINNDSNGNFLRVQKDSWGSNGSNAGYVTLIMKNQSVTGNIVIDEISTLDMTLNENSYFEGNINKDNKAKQISLTIDASSKLKLTADSYVTSLDDADQSYSNIDFNGYKLYVNNKAIN